MASNDTSNGTPCSPTARIDRHALGGDPRLQTIAASILDGVMRFPELHTPFYCDDIKSEMQGQAAAEDLPLVYLWNENLTRGSYSLSINDGILGFLLETQLPRTDPDFNRVREYLSDTLATAMTNTVNKTCARYNAPPSRLF
jgi:hypothetical protein